MGQRSLYFYLQIGLCLSFLSCEKPKPQPPTKQVMPKNVNSPSEALAFLQVGNKAFSQSESKNNALCINNDHFSANAQSPMAIILACADSRVAPEIIFDAGLGELFVIRVAGNVAGDLGLESIVFGVEALKCPLIVVLGHQNCGAVEAVLANTTALIPEIARIIDAALESEGHSRGHQDLKQAIIDNVIYNCGKVENNPSVSKKIAEGKVEVVGAYFDFNTKKVEFIQKPTK